MKAYNEYLLQITALRTRAKIRRDATGRKKRGEDRLAMQLECAADTIAELVRIAVPPMGDGLTGEIQLGPGSVNYP